MIISSGEKSVLENKNRKTVKFFGEVQLGDVIEVRVNLAVKTTFRVSDRLVTIHNITQGTSRTDAPIYINLGLEKLSLESVLSQDELEYQRGYKSAVSELQGAYDGGYIEEMFDNYKDGEE